MGKLFTIRDKELVTHFKEGSQLAFEELYTRYKDRLMYFCRRSMKDETSSEDIVHDIFLQLLETSDGLNPELPFWGYLQTLAQNRILNEFRKFDVHSRFVQYVLMNEKDATNQTENIIIDKDYEKLLNEVIESLSPRQKEIYQLTRIQGLTHKEIAELMQISVETVREHVYISLKKIKKYLRQHADIHFNN